MRIHFGPEPIDGIKYRLLELPDDACLEQLQSGGEMSIRGGPDDEVIMAIGEHTLRVRELCTSNTFLLVNAQTGLVYQKASTLLEAAPIKGLTERLVRLLKSHPYEGPTESSPVPEALHKGNLSEVIQASDREIQATLKANGALLIKEHWRILGAAYICRFFELFFTTALLEDWPVASGVLSRHAVITKFREDFYEDFGDELILNHLMTIFQEGDETTYEWKVSESKVCRFFGHQLLRAKAHWDSSDLLLAWKKLVGEFTPRLEMLRGLALFDGAHHALEEGQVRLTLMDADELPCSPAERFKLLFQTRNRWFYDDLLPFIDGLEETEKQLQGLMLKYARFSTDQASGRKVVTPLLPP